MISFIVIGMNEAKTVALTIKSIYDYVEFNSIDSYEIIYVDSKSTDNSIEIVQTFDNNIKIFEIIGDINAAIARDIGANEAKGDIFIFLDADMQIEKEFHKVVFRDGIELIYPFISGQLNNIYYDREFKRVVGEKLHFPTLKSDRYEPVTGGFFIIDRDLWFEIGGMNTKYRRSQDMDFGLRLAKKGILLFRKKEMFVIHHTISYLDNSRAWKMLFNGSLLFQTSVMIRDHLFNRYMYRVVFRQHYTLLLLFVSIFSTPLSLYILTLHPIAIFLRVIWTKKPIKLLSYYYLRDIFSFLGLFLFYPRPKKLLYRAVKKDLK